ncbi:MAG: 4-deoxy-4-formamido-L-arabinose-phosphoundecaprenol deformylase [Acidobacteriia bacterium]|nr:4-deoxy-4-formamido-L-arabinose-phosphoundecaprenol deformylase [Terriglobia bacterium]
MTAPTSAKLLGLRIDVDTHDGMKNGVPVLLDAFREAGVKGTFYLSMGPDNSGKAILNVLRRPGFLGKMRRTGAARVYGLRTVLSGTLLPARMIAVAFPGIARRIVAEGHEAGVHAWDHRRWQDKLPRLSENEVAAQLGRARQAFLDIFGETPRTFAAPAWFGDERALKIEEWYELGYASDCRGTEPFLPIVDGAALSTPQVPATLPTLDEALGDTHTEPRDFFASMLDAAASAAWPVLTVHAELEGGPYAADLRWFLERARERGIEPVPLRELLAARRTSGVPLPEHTMEYGTVPGRHGTVFMPRKI